MTRGQIGSFQLWNQRQSCHATRMHMVVPRLSQLSSYAGICLGARSLLDLLSSGTVLRRVCSSRSVFTTAGSSAIICASWMSLTCALPCNRFGGSFLHRGGTAFVHFNPRLPAAIAAFTSLLPLPTELHTAGNKTASSAYFVNSLSQ